MSEAAANPLLATSGLPDFARIEPAHVAPAVQLLLERSRARLAELEPQLQPTWEGSLGLLEELDRPFDYAWKPVSHLLSVKNSPEMRAAYEAALPEIVAFGLQVRQSEPIYRALVALRDSAAWAQLTPARQRIVTDRIRDAELAGIALQGAAKERFNAIEQELSQLGTQFSNNVLDVTKAYALDITSAADTEGWPSTLRQLAAQAWNKGNTAAATPATPEAGPWRITLETSLSGPFLEHCRQPALRERLYRDLATRASVAPHDNSVLIEKILRLRRESAHLLNYANYAEVSLAQKMAPSVAAIQEMFDRLREAAWPACQSDVEDLRQLRRERGEGDAMHLWDITFYAERLRESRYAFTDEELRPYFPFERVLQGLFDLCERLFGIRIQHADEGISVWHDDVRYYRVSDESGREIAGFYLDPYSRPENKRGGAWMNNCLGRRRLPEGIQLPVAHLVCNQTPPAGGRPALMTFREAETLFHEMGHGLQHMLTVIDDADAAGISGVEWDAVELPSQFMENWCYHRPTLMGMTGHYQTGAPLPEELFEKLCAARTYRAGSIMLRQLLFGMVDIELHTTFDPDGSETVFDVFQRIAQHTAVIQPLPEDRFLCSFQHIFGGGYAAGYYSYKWAEILSADAFGAFEEVGLDNEAAVQATGRRFRDTVLALGGSRHPMDVFRDFRGREPQVESLLKQAGLLEPA